MQNWTLHHCHGNLLPLWVHQRLSDNLMSLARALSRSGDQLESVAGLVSPPSMEVACSLMWMGPVGVVH